MKKQRAWIQGDIVLLEDKLPKDAVEIVDHDGVLAHGEMTGYSHRIPPNQARFFRSEKGNFLVALVDIPGLLHEDHSIGRKMIPRGTTIRYYQEREVDWWNGVIRDVAD